MYLVIDSECSVVPNDVKFLPSEGSALLNLLRCLGYASENPPLGDLLRRVDGLDGHWIILSPVYWQATHNDALIVAAGKELELTETDAKAYFELFAEYLAEDGVTLHYHNSYTWLLQEQASHPLKAKPVYQLLQKSLMPELAQLDATLFWQKFITESQMLLASQPKQSVINGVWPWGNALLEQHKEQNICVDELFLPFAQKCSSKVAVYHPEINLKAQEILLIKDLSSLSAEHQEELKKIKVQWYWNNTAYISGTSNWLVYLWRKLIYAD